MNNTLKTRFWLSILTVLAFFVPFAAVVAVEHAKNTAKVSQAQTDYLNSLSASDQARLAYSQNIEAKKIELLKTMADAQAQYDSLLAAQPAQVAAHQQTSTQTVTQQVAVQKITQPAATNSAPPKATRKTKTS